MFGLRLLPVAKAKTQRNRKQAASDFHPTHSDSLCEPSGLAMPGYESVVPVAGFSEVGKPRESSSVADEAEARVSEACVVSE
jgi:hypothetical protein